MAATYLNSAQAAHRLGIAKGTLYRAVKRGAILPALRTPGGRLRFLVSDVEAYDRCRGRSRSDDWTTRELAETALRESEQRYQQVETHAPIGLALVAPDGRWLRVNPALCTLVGYTAEELLARSFQDISHPDDLDLDLEYVRQMLTGEIATYQMEKRYIRKDGTVVWVLLSVSLVRDAAERPQYFISQVQDIGVRKQAEQALEQARAAAEELAQLRQQQAAEAEAMAAVSTALSSALNPGTVYHIILTQAARVLPFDHAAISLYQDGWVINVATLGGPAIPPGTPLVPVNPRTGTWQALASGKPAYLADTAEVPDWTDLPPWQGPYRVRSMIIAPLLIDGVLIGAFRVTSYTPHFYSAQHIRRVTAFAERAGQAVRNARLYAAEQERARAAEELARLRQEQAEESRALAEVGAALADVLDPARLYEVILRQSTAVLPGDLTNLLLYQDGWVTVAASAGALAPAVGTRICPLDGSAQFWLPSTTAPTYLPDTTQEPTWREITPTVGEHRIRSIIAVPLLVDGVTVGSFDVCSTVPHFYTARHVHLARVFAERVAQALRNARLYAAEQRARHQAELAEANLRAIIGASPAPMVTYDSGGMVASWNAAAEHIFGWRAEEVIGRPAPMVPAAEQSTFDRLCALTLRGAEVRDQQARWLRQDGSRLDLQFSLAPLHGAGGSPTGIIAVFADITARKRMEEALMRQALHDALTGLPNRTLLAERLQQALAADRGDPLSLALLLLDLDNFKEVNDTLGHLAGDSLLHAVGARLQAQQRPSDIVARLGGDEFAILLHGTSAGDAITVAQRVLAALAAPCMVEGHSVQVRASMGIALSPSHGTDPTTLLRKADVAMYVAKRSRSGYAVYRAEQDEHSLDRLTMGADLRLAIEQGHLQSRSSAARPVT